MSQAFRIFPVLVVSGLTLALLPSCSSSDTTPAAAATKLSEQLKRLGDSVGSSTALLKSSALTPASLTPADFGSVARIVKSLTGNLDIGIEQKGKTGDKSANVDGADGDEAASIFVPDPPTGGTSTSATYPTFLAWKGHDAWDKGLCYLAWSKGGSWFVIGKCGDTNGAYVCQGGDSAACSACNVAGDCTPCDMEQSTFTCAWP